MDVWWYGCTDGMGAWGLLVYPGGLALVCSVGWLMSRGTKAQKQARSSKEIHNADRRLSTACGTLSVAGVPCVSATVRNLAKNDGEN